jgi:RimJ/RimL family protein N-acetyltransferase
MNEMAITDCVDAGAVRVEKPFPDYALPRVWSWIQDFRQRVSDDFSPQTLSEFVAQWEQLKPTRTTWGVWRGAELGGLVAWEPWPVPGVGASHALFKREFWGHATTRTALELVYSELFSQGARKVLGFPFQSNHAIISLCRNVGFYTEGVLRHQTLQNGKPTDVVVLGLLKEDFEKCLSSRGSRPLSPQQSSAAAPQSLAAP